MAIRAILAGLSGGTASNGTAELSCRLAARLGAHLTALHIGPDVAGSVIAGGAEGLAASAGMHRANKIRSAVGQTAEATKAAFEAAATRHDLPLTDNPGDLATPSAFWREETGDAAALLADQARFFDLALLGRSDRVIDAPHTDAIEQVLLSSGRPVLLAPAEPPDSVSEVVAVAWNGSAQAVRALTAALPFLRLASRAVLLALGSERDDDTKSVQTYLKRHGITAETKSIPGIPDERPGGQLLSAARDEGADLLVLGGYGQAPWREALFGGATSELLSRSHLPLFLAH